MINKKRGTKIIIGLVIVLMTSTTLSSAIKINNTDVTKSNNVLNNLGAEKEMTKTGWSGKARFEEGWSCFTSSESGDAAHCDYCLSFFGWSYIYYSFQLDEWDITDGISNVQVSLYYDADTSGFNEGPDIRVTNDDNKYGDAYTLIEQGIGSPQQYEWKSWTKDSSQNALINYVNINGQIYFCVLNAAGCHTKLDKIKLNWRIDNYIPTAEISVDISNPLRNQEVTVSGGDSSDSDGEIIEYKWKVDGVEKQDTNSNIRISFSNSGEHVISLKVKDDDGAWSKEVTKTVTVQGNQKPEMDEIIPPSKVYARTSYDFTFKATDPENDQIQFYIDWGDDSHTGWTSLSDQYTTTACHVYSSAGKTYTITARAKDASGAESSPISKDVTTYKKTSKDLLFLNNAFKKTPILYKILSLLNI